MLKSSYLSEFLHQSRERRVRGFPEHHAGTDGNDSDLDDEEMDHHVLRELELVRQAREQPQQQEHAPQNDPPHDDGTSPMASSGAPPPPPAPNLRAIPLELTLPPSIALQMPAGTGGLSIRRLVRSSRRETHLSAMRRLRQPPRRRPRRTIPRPMPRAAATPPTLPHAVMATLRPQVLRGGSTSRTSSPQSSASRSSSRTISCNASATAQTIGRNASRFCSSLRRRISRRTRKSRRRSSRRLGFQRTKAAPQKPRARGPT